MHLTGFSNLEIIFCHLVLLSRTVSNLSFFYTAIFLWIFRKLLMIFCWLFSMLPSLIPNKLTIIYKCFQEFATILLYLSSVYRNKYSLKYLPAHIYNCLNLKRSISPLPYCGHWALSMELVLYNSDNYFLHPYQPLCYSTCLWFDCIHV